MYNLTHSNSWRRSYNLNAARFYSVIILLAMAFVLNDITTISSHDLKAVGMDSDAMIVQFIPFPTLVLWIICTQIWITKCRTFSAWAIRLICLQLVTLSLSALLWLYAFRNTERFEIQSIPGHSQILQIQNETKQKLSWTADSAGNYVTFDNRNPKNEGLLRKALMKHNIALKQ